MPDSGLGEAQGIIIGSNKDRGKTAEVNENIQNSPFSEQLILKNREEIIEGDKIHS